MQSRTDKPSDFPPPMGKLNGRWRLVSSADNDLGPGRLVDWVDAETAIIEYFDSPAASQQPRATVRRGSLTPYKLTEQSRVYYEDPDTYRWSVGRVIGIIGDNAFVRFPNDRKAMIPHGDLQVRWHRPIDDPTAHLCFRLNETPYWHSGRAQFNRSLILQRGACAGIRHRRTWWWLLSDSNGTGDRRLKALASYSRRSGTAICRLHRWRATAAA